MAFTALKHESLLFPFSFFFFKITSDCVALADSKLRDLPAFATWVLALKVCVVMPGVFDIFIVPALRNIAAYVFIVDSRSTTTKKKHHLWQTGLCMYFKLLLFNVTPSTSESHPFCSLHPFTRHNLGMCPRSLFFSFNKSTLKLHTCLLSPLFSESLDKSWPIQLKISSTIMFILNEASVMKCFI